MKAPVEAGRGFCFLVCFMPRSDLNLIFATPEGDYLKPDSVTAKVCFVARKLGFSKGVSLHTLRHTQRQSSSFAWYPAACCV